MNSITSQWFDLDSAVKNLANKKINIPQLLEFGRLGELSMYVLLDKGLVIKFWDMKTHPPILKQQEITDFLQLSPDQIQKIQKMYPLGGLSISIDALLPEGGVYDLPDFYPIHMRMESKHLPRGGVLRSYVDIRVSGRELDIFKSRQEIQSKVSRSSMAKPIEDIRRQIDEPNNKVAIWEALKKLSLSKNPPPPIVGYINEGIQYRGEIFDESGEPDVYTNTAFRSYMIRHPHP
jgi:hypothetical protein